MQKPSRCPIVVHTCYYLTLLMFVNLVLSSTLLSQPRRFHISALFQDNMVLQQRSQVPIWGKGIPQVRVSVQGSWGKKSVAIVGSDSMWNLKLATPKAGGPYEISIHHEDSILTLKNVLIGEVWLCSGQSNMEMPLEGWPPNDTISNYAYEIEHAQFPKMRLFNVQRNFSIDPTGDCVGTWKECSPSTVRSFSATAYFFGKKLHEALKIPVGLIEAAWGGTPVESWMSKQMLSKFGEFTHTLKMIDECRDSVLIQARWLSQCPTINVTTRDPLHKWEGLQFQDESCSASDAADSAWYEMILPTLWERTSLGEFDGAVWFRKRVEIPFAWVGKALTVHLGPVDDMDETYVNGEKIGGMMKEGLWKTERVYGIPDSLVRDSVIYIAVRVIDYQGGGGIWGDGKPMYISWDSSETKVSISGVWKYLPVAEYRAGFFWIFGANGSQFKNRPKLPIEFSGYSPTALFNGMINPVLPFAIKGAIWYQGESNANNPALYGRTFPAMIEDWRRAFREKDFPFYFVQIAPYAYGEQTHSEYLRESQFQTLKIKNTGMAVTLDIGDPKNIHPANKQSVGNRLALWALGKTHGKRIVFSGPLYKTMRKVKNNIILSFECADKGLVLQERNGENSIVIAGEDRVFRKANVRVEGNKLVVYHPEIQKPMAVRYAWGNTSEATLFNKESLPASSFRTDTW